MGFENKVYLRGGYGGVRGEGERARFSGERMGRIKRSTCLRVY